MPSTPSVDYDKFESLGGLDLCHYMEPLVNDPTTIIGDDILEKMLHMLPTYKDEYHLVYAITLGAERSPETFASQLPAYLVDERGSVWSAAFRGLAVLPDEYVTESLLGSLRELSRVHPCKPWIAEIENKLAIRLQAKSDT